MKSTCLFAGCIMVIAVFIVPAHSLCVFESNFGFNINCAFKKSGLFRVRNLGGIKAHASLGFSLGDELGFDQSLTNLDQSRRRSVSVKNGVPPNLIDTPGRTTAKNEKRGKQNRLRPAAPSNRPSQAAMDRLSSLHRSGSTAMQPIVVPVGPISRPPTVTMAKPLPMGIPAFRPLPPKEEPLTVVPITSNRKSFTPLQIPQSKGPAPAYQSEIYPQSHNQISKMVSQMTAEQYSPIRYSSPIIAHPKLFSMTTVNPFVPMPAQAISIIPAPAFKEIHSTPAHKTPYNTILQNPISNFIDPVPHQVNDLAVFNTKKVDDYNSITAYGDDTNLNFNKEDIDSKIAEIAKAGNISMEAVEAAIALRQQQLLSKYANLPAPAVPATSTSTSSTTETPFVFQPQPEPEILTAALPQKTKRVPSSGKVMNAPHEYYPVGYEKNFDDHFQSKVDLPETSFHCGDQKYFPGLYGDESLGCMVFHVCALTDDGLVMKSFLCPESTLFDQTILKCNWWFYVDCKNTHKLYDTNIPVSKSYQLMKALTFFSSYKKEMHNETSQQNPEDVDGVKEAISILQNDPKPAADTSNAIHYVTPTPIIDERHKTIDTTQTAPVYRGTRNFNINNTRVNITEINSNNGTKPEITLVTVTADMNMQNDSERKHRRRMTLKNSSKSTHSEIQSPLAEAMKKEIQPMAPVKEEKLTDQLEESFSPSNLAPVRRVYRSSGEKDDREIPVVNNERHDREIPVVNNENDDRVIAVVNNEKDDREMVVVNNERVQIVRPKMVGYYPTQMSSIQKLDDAVLGKRLNETVNVESSRT